MDLNQTVPGDQHSPLHSITAAKYALLEISQVIVEVSGVDLVIFMFIFCFTLKAMPLCTDHLFLCRLRHGVMSSLGSCVYQSHS